MSGKLGCIRSLWDNGKLKLIAAHKVDHVLKQKSGMACTNLLIGKGTRQIT